MRLSRFKILLLVAVIMAALFTVCDASACSSAIHFAQNISGEHVGMAMAVVAIVPINAYVKENCTISPTDLADLALKYGKIKILNVVLEPPTYDVEGNITDAGEFYCFACKRPDQGVIRIMLDYAKKGDTDKYIECFIKNIVVAGDIEKLKTDGLVYLGLASEADNFIKPYESFLAKA